VGQTNLYSSLFLCSHHESTFPAMSGQTCCGLAESFLKHLITASTVDVSLSHELLNTLVNWPCTATNQHAHCGDYHNAQMPHPRGSECSP